MMAEQFPRVGLGYDVHRLEGGRRLILCGVDIPYELGLLGHSDADVAAHALTDALLGACAMGDIGAHFPDTDERFRGADSIGLLKEAVRRMAKHGFVPYNCDITISYNLDYITIYHICIIYISKFISVAIVHH